jgi:hypothetical protein
VVADTQTEESMLAASTTLANEVFKRLPPKFTIGNSKSNPISQSANDVPPAQAPGAAQPTATIALPILASPKLVSPADGSVFNSYPRTTTLAWSPVDRASKYIVEIMACSTSNPLDCFIWPNDRPPYETKSTSYTFNFVGSQPGKWRVTAVEANGIHGTPSDWWNFSYQK